MEQQGQILKVSRSAALATLVRILGDFDLAEEAVQEASYRAVIDWRTGKIPDNPVAWLVQTARRFATDKIRHNKMILHNQTKLAALSDNSLMPDDELRISVLHQHDDQLRLIFTCCHPSLPIESQVALTLKTVADLDTEEIARAYLIPTSTLQRRLNRAKEKIRDDEIPYAIPADQQLEERLDAVLRVIYLIYNQAYTALKGSELLNYRLSEVAIYLARVLNRLMRDQPEAQGLLALLLFQHARATARTDDDGLPVPLDQQDRKLWNQNLITQANVMLEKSDRHWKPGPYQIQAAIAAVHCNASSAEQTNWQEIIYLYDFLERCTPSPVVTLNRAIAVSRQHGPGKGLELLNAIADNKQISGFQYFHSARAGLLEELGEFQAACEAFEQAKKLCQNDAEKRFMESKIQQLSN